MLALAGAPLQIACTTLDPAADSPASQVAPAIVGAYDDLERLAELAAGVDLVTYEFENVPVDAARFVETLRPVFPPPAALEAAQDRLSEKQLFEGVGLEVPPYAPVDSLGALTDALAHIGTPAVVKSRRLGYDGKGQAVIHDAALAEDAWRSIGEVPALLEAFVPFDREVSIVAARGRDGDVRRLSAGGEPPSRRDPAPHAGAGARRHRRDADDGRTTRANGHGLARLRRGPRDRAVLRGRASARERDGAPRAQQRPLDRRRRRDQPVRTAPSRDRGTTAGVDRSRRRERHGEPDRCGARPWGGRRDRGSAPARLRQGAATGSQGGAHHRARRRSRGLGTASCSACSSWSKRPSRDRWRRSARSRTMPRWAPTDAPRPRGLSRTPA